MARKIEEKIIDCLRQSDFLDDNQKKVLSSRDSITLQKTQKRVYLHGNCIFTLGKENIKFSFQGWQTFTTKSRINALLSAFSSCSAGIYQKNYQLIFSSSAGEFPIYADRVYTVKNGKPEEVESI